MSGCCVLCVGFARCTLSPTRKKSFTIRKRHATNPRSMRTSTKLSNILRLLLKHSSNKSPDGPFDLWVCS